MTRAGWTLLAALALGMAVGLGLFTFGYARGYSYLTNDPEACANCHIMSEHFAAWTKASHKTVATCNDCHTPHDLVGKYIVKAKNGFWHSFYFTTGNFPDPLRITEVRTQPVARPEKDSFRAAGPADHPPASDGGSGRRQAVTHSGLRWVDCRLQRPAGPCVRQPPRRLWLAFVIVAT